MPADTELIITVSPIERRPRVKSMCQAVPKATWRAAASLSFSSSGTFTSCLVGATMYSAKPPGPGHADEHVATEQVGHHALPDLPVAVDVGAELRDRAHDLETEDVREVDLEARDALADVDVHVVERAGVHLDAHVPRLELRVLDLLELQAIRAAELVDAHRLHATSSFPVVALETTASRPTSLMPDISTVKPSGALSRVQRRQPASILRGPKRR